MSATIGTEGPTLYDRIAALAQAHGNAEIRLVGQLPHLPAAVIDAIEGAAAEALRNSLRHAPGSTVSVWVFGQGHGVRVTVRDDGPGFTMADRAGFGLTHSVNERMREVGGTVSLTTREGRGTTIGLAWRPEPEGDLHDALVDLVGSPRRLIVLLTVPLMAASWYLVIVYGLHDGSTVVTLSVALTATVLAVLVGASAGTRWATAVGVVAVVAVPVLNLIGLLNAGPGAITGFRGWSIGLTGNVTLAMAASQRGRWTFSAAAGIAATSLWVAVDDPTVSPFDAIGAIVQPVFFAGAGVLVAQALLRAWRDTTSAFTEAEHARAQALLAEVQDIALAEQAARLGADLSEFLEAASDGRADLDDPDVKSEARVLAARVRDELDHPGAWGGPLRAALDAARRRGSTVEFRALAPAPWPDTAHHLATAVLDEVGGESVTVTLRASDTSAHVRVVVVPEWPAPRTTTLASAVGQRCPAAALDIVSDGDATIIDLRESR